jgi:hypothetical protein
MDKSKRDLLYILFNEIAIGVGFAGGLEKAIGIDPYGMFINTCMNATLMFNPNADLTVFNLLSLLPTILFIGALLTSYVIGKELGVLCFILATVGDLIIVQFTFGSIVLYIISFYVAGKAVLDRDKENKDYYF